MHQLIWLFVVWPPHLARKVAQLTLAAPARKRDQVLAEFVLTALLTTTPLRLSSSLTDLAPVGIWGPSFAAVHGSGGGRGKLNLVSC